MLQQLRKKKNWDSHPSTRTKFNIRKPMAQPCPSTAFLLQHLRFWGVQHVPSTKWGCGKTYNQTQMEGSWFCLTMFKPIWEKFPFNLLVFLTSSIMTSCLDLIPIVASETIGIFISPGIIPLKPTTKNGIPTMNPNQPWFQAMISCLLCSELAMFTPNLDVEEGKDPVHVNTCS